MWSYLICEQDRGAGREVCREVHRSARRAFKFANGRIVRRIPAFMDVRPGEATDNYEEMTPT